MTKTTLSLAQAWKASHGPDGRRAAIMLALKGFCMGGADIIPGVSGGTIAFITGIYDQLLDAIRSFDATVLRRALRFDLPGALAASHLRFLVILGSGIVAALLSMARIMSYLLANHPVHLWSLFFGLIAASILVVARTVGERGAANFAWAALGAAFSYQLVGMIPVTTPETSWFLFLCGALAICAMILPGISGAFILLLLGKYEYVTATLKNPFLPGNLLIIAVFLCGAVCGIVVFSRVLHYLLHRWHGAAMSVLAGFMIGAMRKVWPWKEILETRQVGHKLLVISERNVAPAHLDGSFWLAVGLMVCGAAAVLLLERLSASALGDTASDDSAK